MNCTIEGCPRPYRARGYCASHYNQILKPDRHRITHACEECGQEYTTTRTDGRFCSLVCRDAESRRRSVAKAEAKMPAPPVNWKAATAHLRSALRAALEDGDSAGVLAAIRNDVQIDSQGCWVWQRSIRDGYPIVQIAGKMRYVHRLSLEASLGVPLGSQPAHHICAKTECCNPNHLQPITHRENVAEMMARTYMVRRIADLEAALTEASPGHPLLIEVGLPTVA